MSSENLSEELKLKFNDSRSFKVLVVPDYFVNSSNYPELPDLTNLREEIEKQGYGLIKMPPPKASRRAVKWYIETVVDQIQEYMNRGFEISVLMFSFIPGGGVWYKSLKKEILRRKIKLPSFIQLSKKKLGVEHIAKELP